MIGLEQKKVVIVEELQELGETLITQSKLILSYENSFYYMECSEQMLSQNCKKATTFNGTQFEKWPLTTNNADV